MASQLLIEIGLLIAALAVAGTIARWLNQSVIPFYIVAGLLVGDPSLQIGSVNLGVVTDTEFVTGAADLGIVLLLFFLGLEFSLSSLLSDRSHIARAGGIDLIINLPLGIAIGLAFGFSLVESLFIGGIVYISSSAIISKSLIDLEWLANRESETILGVLVFEDLFIAIFLSVLSAIALGGGGLEETIARVGASLAVMVVLLLIAAFAAEQLGSLLEVRSDEMAMLRALAIAVLGAGVALYFGLSEAVAAFFVGMAFGETGHVGRLERLMDPLRDLFAAVFFFWIGLRMDPRLLLSAPVLVAVAVLATGVAKIASGVLAGRVYDLDPRRQRRVGFALIPRAEFSLIIATLASLSAEGPVLTQTIPAFTVAYVLVLSFVGPILMQNSERIESLIERARHVGRDGPPM